MDRSTKHAHCVVQWLNQSNIGTLPLWVGFLSIYSGFLCNEVLHLCPNKKKKKKKNTNGSFRFFLFKIL